jgi:phage shock protein PspC (stress-responsive transcriptional regulator)
MDISTGPTTNSALPTGQGPTGPASTAAGTPGTGTDGFGTDGFATDGFATDGIGTDAGSRADTAGPPATGTRPAERPAFRLVRSRSDRMLGGVCGGLGKTLGVDPALLRIGLVVLTVLGAGAGAIIYLAAWILAPEED